MEVSLYRTGSNVLADDNVTFRGTLLMEIVSENDTERSLFRGFEKEQKDIEVVVGDQGGQLYIFKKAQKEKHG